MPASLIFLIQEMGSSCASTWNVYWEAPASAIGSIHWKQTIFLYSVSSILLEWNNLSAVSDFKFDHNELKIVDQYKYVGIILHENLDYNVTTYVLDGTGGRALGAVILTC